MLLHLKVEQLSLCSGFFKISVCIDTLLVNNILNNNVELGIGDDRFLK